MANIIKPSGVNQLWAAGGTRVDPGLSKINIGWVVELPPYQYQNWLDNRQDTYIAHINQHGIPEWDSETEYQGNLSYTQGSDGIIYKCIQTHTNLDPANPLNNLYWQRAFEPYGSVAVVQTALTTHLTNYATLSGIANPVAARANLSLWSRAESDARYAYKAGEAGVAFTVANATLSGHAVNLGQLNSLLVPASEGTAGIIRIATLGETEGNTVDTKAISPLKADTVFLKKSGNLSGLANVATARTNLGLGTAATLPSTTWLAVSNNLSDLASVSSARTNLGLTSLATTNPTTVMFKADNLAGLANVATARTNLGLGTAALSSASSFLTVANNLSDLDNVATARSNLGLGTAATLASTTWLTRTNNLSDLTNVATARANLGLGTAATATAADFMTKAANLSDVTNVATARSNLGLSDSATLPSTTWMRGSNNLSEVTNIQTARNNLGLGTLATWNPVGVNAAGTSGSILDFTANLTANGSFVLPNGAKVIWGTFNANASGGLGAPQLVTLADGGFDNAIFYANVSPSSGASAGVEYAAIDWNTANKTTRLQLGVNTNYFGICKYIAVGF